MVKCSYCEREIEKGTGKIMIDKAGKQMKICSSKCQKNLKLGRKPQKLKWVTKKEKKK